MTVLKELTVPNLAPPRRLVQPWAPGLLVVVLGLATAFGAHRVLPQVGILTWSVALGVLMTNVGLLPATARPALNLLTKRLLRVGVVLLGFAVSFSSITALALPVIALIVVTLVGTLLFTTWLGNRMGLGRARSLVIGTGFAICGASAIAAMEETAGADEEDVTAAIAMVTLWGTVALVVLPLLQAPLGLTGLQFGIWTGASVQEVGQVVAAASPAGAVVLATAVVVKLTRVLLLAPVVASVSLGRRLRSPSTGTAAGRPPVVPLFVLGFVTCAALRSTGVLPEEALGALGQVQVAALGAALFGMGASVQLASLIRRSGPLMAVTAASTLFVNALPLAGVLLLVRGS